MNTRKESQSHDIRESIRTAMQRIMDSCGMEATPKPLTLTVCKSRWDWLLAKGYITEDGNMTDKFGREFGRDFTDAESVG